MRAAAQNVVTTPNMTQDAINATARIIKGITLVLDDRTYYHDIAHMSSLPLTRQEDLKLYFFVVRPGNTFVTTAEEGFATVTYTSDEAHKAFVDAYNAKGKIATGRLIGAVSVKNILDKVPPQQTVTLVEEEKPKARPLTRKMTDAQFLVNLKLVSDKFVKDPTDRDALNAIISRAESSLE